jgi:hypothetical protein
MAEALAYCGTLVAEVVNSYDAFDELPDEEKTFIDDYIVSVGERLREQGEARLRRQRSPKDQAIARGILRALEKGRGL